LNKLQVRVVLKNEETVGEVLVPFEVDQRLLILMAHDDSSVAFNCAFWLSSKDKQDRVKQPDNNDQIQNFSISMHFDLHLYWREHNQKIFAIHIQTYPITHEIE